MPTYTPDTLAAALASGETDIRLASGTYGGFTISTPGATVQSATGNLATVAGRVTLAGAHTTIRDVAIVAPSRQVNGFDGVWMRGHCCRAINNVIVDCGQGVGSYAEADSGEIVGNLILDVGWDAAPRGHGHGMYLAHESAGGKHPTKVVARNVVHAPFASGIRMGAATTETARLRVERNVVSRAGAHSQLTPSEACIQQYDEHGRADDIVIDSNVVWDPTATEWSVFLGRQPQAQPYGSVTVSNNWVRAGRPVRWGGRWGRVTVEGNTIAGCRGSDTGVDYCVYDSGESGGRSLDRNVYYHNPPVAGRSWRRSGSTFTLAAWRSTIGGESQSTQQALSAMPAAQWVIADPYESGRFTVAAYNPSLAATVSVDLPASQAWWAYNAHDPLGGAVASGSGAVAVLPTAMTARTPAGASAVTTAPEFCVWVIRSTSSWVAP